MYPYQAMAYYFDGEPNVVIDDFNKAEPQFAHLCEDWVMTFEAADDAADGIKLFGTPSSGYQSDTALLLQFDPLAYDTGFLENIDGYAYFFFGEDVHDIDAVGFVIDRS